MPSWLHCRVHMEKMRLIWLVKSFQSEAMKLPVVQSECSLVHLLVLELGHHNLCKHPKL